MKIWVVNYKDERGSYYKTFKTHLDAVMFWKEIYPKFLSAWIEEAEE